MLFICFFYVSRRAPPPFSGGHDLTSPGRGIRNLEAGHGWQIFLRAVKATMVRLHQNWYKVENLTTYLNGEGDPNRYVTQIIFLYTPGAAVSVCLSRACTDFVFVYNGGCTEIEGSACKFKYSQCQWQN